MATYPGGSLRLDQGDTRDVSRRAPGPEKALGECGLIGCRCGRASAGQQTRWVFCTMDDEVYPEHLCQPQPRPADRRPCSSQPCPHTKR